MDIFSMHSQHRNKVVDLALSSMHPMPGYGGFVPRHAIEPHSNTEEDSITDRMCSTSRRTYRYTDYSNTNICHVQSNRHYMCTVFTVYIYTERFQPVSIRCWNMLTKVHSQKQWPWHILSTHSTKQSSRYTVTDIITMHMQNMYHSHPNRNYIMIATVTLISVIDTCMSPC